MNIKNILILFILFYSFINFSFSYSLTHKENEKLNKIYLKIDKIENKQLIKLEKRVSNLIKKKINNKRMYFLLLEIDNYILNKLNLDNDIINNEFKVLKIIDWDTIIINYFWKRENIRFIWIDAPENSKIRKGFIECYWKESKDYLYNLLNNKKIKLEFDETQWKRDKYDRLLAYVILNWENINNLIIKNGFAFEYTYNKPYKYLDLFKKSQEEAKKNKIWIWSLENCKLDYWNKKKEIYIPKKDSFWNICDIKWNISYKTKKKLYHIKTCPWYKRTKINLDKWEKWFCSEKEAIKKWWEKAWNCK